MKILLIAAVAFAVYLFYPTYDLLKVEYHFDNEIVDLVDTGFINRDRCRAAASKQHLEHHKCLKKTVWGSAFSGYRKYNYKPDRSDSNP